jgi:signal transduction histidine kinase/phage shock protein PspC (stress-responsive transcriptional regulator)
MVGLLVLCDDCGAMNPQTSRPAPSGPSTHPDAHPAASPFGHAGARPGTQPRRATRSSEGRLLGGVAAGLAAHLRVDVLWVRVAFVISAALGGFGVALYAGLWMILPTDAHFTQAAPGLEAATRQGRRPGGRRRFEEVGPVVALGAVALGVVVLLQSLVGRGLLFWPLLLGTVGLAVLWRQADEAQRERWLDTTGRIDPVRAVLGRGGTASYARLVVGVLLLAAALTLFAVQTTSAGELGVARDVLLAGALGVGGLALTVGPWLFRLAGDLSEERAARVRSQERADMAAHLHDSVLQTLTLIQKQADDPRTVARLARAQELDLRAWLYEEHDRTETSLAAALRAAAAEVEDAHGVAVEVVTVGDVSAGERSRPLELAAREAMVNAAKHSGTAKVDVFAEVAGGVAEVFVRDRGSGFALAEVPEDRLGVRHSIVDRMRRHGGSAEIVSAPGEGTEVRLRMTGLTEGTQADE